MKLTILTIITILILTNLTSAITLSNDDYAVEVVLNRPGTSYNLFNIDNIENVELISNKYILASEYNSKLALILYPETKLTTGKSEGLVIRLQLPTKEEETSIPYLKITSTTYQVNINPSIADYFNGWDILCSNQECKLKKQGTEFSITEISKNRYDISIESYKGLTSSGLGLNCFSKFGNSICITNELKNDLNDVLNHIGVVSSFDKLVSSVSVVNVGNKVTTILSLDTSLNPDWKEAMRQELVRLKKEKIIEVEDKDIEEIVSLVEQGKSGKNSRIIYNSDSESYTYYYQTTLPILTEELNSEPFKFPITGQVTSSNPISNIYYLIPIIITLAFFFIFIILIIIAKIITRKRRQKKIKPITGLLSEQ